VFAGQAAAAVVEAARFFSPRGPALRPSGHLVDGRTFALGPFRITPYLVDHSAFDAYAVVVDAGGRRLMYTGDLRGHGRKRSFARMLDRPPTGVDTLLMEGTHVGSERTEPPTEAQVELDLARTLRSTAGLAVVAGSAQNVDRLVTVYRAALRSGRTLLVDLYSTAVAEATGRASIPRPGFPGVGVWAPRRQRVQVKESGQFHRTTAVRPYRVFTEELVARPERYVVLGGSSAAHELLRDRALTAGGTLVWSMWSGYLDEPSGVRLREAARAAGVPLVEHHTSGHASVKDLRRLVAAVKPRAVVPIHTEGADEFARHFPRTTPQRDGAWWSV
jgi:ribonuclease J